MGRAHGKEALSQHWSATCNDRIARVCTPCPDEVAPVGQLPQSGGGALGLHRRDGALRRHGFVGVKLTPDPTGGVWTEPLLTDEQWFPRSEKMCELQVPAMIHVPGSATPSVHGAGA
ncbi:amidohydrolase family protein [Oceanicola sp. S124]|uniref:amidohydrolase family protein n=1 Tax=Oceanicola sp. S124 TaxID=1042378 RepID=UPI0002557A14